MGITLALIVGCGTSTGPSTSGDGGSHGQCPTGQVYCPACNGDGGACANGCERVCPADAGAPADGGCPASMPISCTACSGGTFCTTEECPVVECEHSDAGADVGLDADHTCTSPTCAGDASSD